MQLFTHGACARLHRGLPILTDCHSPQGQHRHRRRHRDGGRDISAALHRNGVWVGESTMHMGGRHHRGHSLHQLALLYIDRDHFKPVNDRCGLLAGDHVLQAFARRGWHDGIHEPATAPAAPS